MKKLKRKRVKRNWVPNCFIYLKGFFHAKKSLTSVENGTIRSPYLLERRFSYAEYREILIRETEEILKPMKQGLFKADAEKKMLIEKQDMLQKKLLKFEEPKNGSECRVKLQLEEEHEKGSLRIAELEAKMQETEENIYLTKQMTLHLLEQNLALLQSKAYVYILGVENGLKNTRYYLEKEDAVRDIFAGLMPSAIQ